MGADFLDTDNLPSLVPPHGKCALKPLMPEGDELAAERARAQVFADVRARGEGPPRGEEGKGEGGGESRRPGAGAVRRGFQGEVRRAVHDARRDARRIRAAWLVAGRGVPDAQSDASLAR